jgi:hypothetical protein
MRATEQTVEIIEAFNALEPPVRTTEQTAFPWDSGQ